jgi:hypothetical protein
MVYPSIYSFWLLLWYLVAIVWSIHRFTASDYSCGILWPLYGLSIDLQLLITPVVSCGHCMVYPLIYGFWLLLWYLVAIVWSIHQFTTSDYSWSIHRFTASDYSCGIFKLFFILINVVFISPHNLKHWYDWQITLLALSTLYTKVWTKCLNPKSIVLIWN